MRILPSLLLSLFTLLYSCFVFAQSATDSVMVIPEQMPLPKGGEFVTTIKTGNNATSTDCDYENDIKDLKTKAHQYGGNVVKIRRLIPPVFISKCFKIEAEVYAYATLPTYQVKADKKDDTGCTDCPTLYIYRLPDTLLMQGNYLLHLNSDSVICQVRSKSHDIIKLHSQGPTLLWAGKEKKAELKLNAESGHSYYIRCGTIKGEIRMDPVLELMTEEKGSKEFHKLAKRKKDVDVHYLMEVH